ncbi:hypothetical protein A2Z67_01765 [Candidatus Woesebacteria bacterium RBG_13_36_22]|uniref:Uncharacterized protein n=1 Tax=Candidatus Woesebacteria bacterium RBG_13_36_22 TaxID=1802478 RepID=A0A1F7X2E6_9BACT|nr:MAG: hypothetical protein A2Z67_01765 [Candidatus Woesebacteria bacterium RBG_13_36_22]
MRILYHAQGEKNLRLLLIRKEGGSRVIAITSLLPKEWQAVTAEVVKEGKGFVTTKIVRVK